MGVGCLMEFCVNFWPTYLELGESSNGLCHLLLAQVLLQEFLQEHLDPGVGVLRRELGGLRVHRHAEPQHTERVPEKWKISLQACHGVRHKVRYIYTVPYRTTVWIIWRPRALAPYLLIM